MHEAHTAVECPSLHPLTRLPSYPSSGPSAEHTHLHAHLQERRRGRPASRHWEAQERTDTAPASAELTWLNPDPSVEGGDLKTPVRWRVLSSEEEGGEMLVGGAPGLAAGVTGESGWASARTQGSRQGHSLAPTGPCCSRARRSLGLCHPAGPLPIPPTNSVPPSSPPGSQAPGAQLPESDGLCRQGWMGRASAGTWVPPAPLFPLPRADREDRLHSMKKGWRRGRRH